LVEQRVELQRCYLAGSARKNIGTSAYAVNDVLALRMVPPLHVIDC
jgi:hypothetical protein